jgi:hypothetical protein
MKKMAVAMAPLFSCCLRLRAQLAALLSCVRCQERGLAAEGVEGAEAITLGGEQLRQGEVVDDEFQDSPTLKIMGGNKTGKNLRRRYRVSLQGVLRRKSEKLGLRLVYPLPVPIA